MKKKIIIPVAVCVLVIGVILFLVFNNKVVSTITLDINPSVEINLDKNDKVINVKAINSDAKKIINNDLKGKSLDETFELLVTNLIDTGYVSKEENNLDIIVHVEGNINNNDVVTKIEYEFGKKEIHTEIVIIENVTKEDEELAKKYNVSPAKAAYVKTINEENENTDIENLVDRSVSELNETKKTGKYCDEGYTLEGDHCYKEISRFAASNGEICPSGYEENKGKCYEAIDATETGKYICNDEFTLVGDKCILEDVLYAMGTCEKGSYKDGYCHIKEYYGDAKEYCRLTPSTDLLYNGRCLGRKPTINGKCLGNDKLINGYCYDTSPSSGYKADWRCPDGRFITNPDGSLMYPDKKCYHESKTEPTSYYCEGDGVLEGNKCKIKTVENAIKEKVCPSGYTGVDDGSRCLNLKKTKNKESGLTCNQDNAELRGNTCIVYDIVDAKS